MIKEQKREYDAPMVELIDARVERGFQSSATTPVPETGEALESYVNGGERNTLFT